MSILATNTVPGVKKLVQRYLDGATEATSFFKVPPTAPGAFKQTAHACLAAYQTDRQVLTEKLLAQNRRWGCSEATEHNIQRLAQKGTLAVVTGQQTGILGGPLFTVYKALTAIVRAEKLEHELQCACVPVFWLVADDHDFAEIDHITLSGKDEVSHSIRYAPTERRAGDAVMHTVVEPVAWGDVMAQLKEVLLPTEQGDDELWTLLHEAYAAGSTLPDAFARMYHALLKAYGIIIVDVTQDALKELGRRVFATEIAQPERSTQLTQDAGTALVAAGFHQQLSFAAANVNLFLEKDGARHKISRLDAGFSIQGKAVSGAEMEAIVAHDTCALSTGVVLRPLLQDTLLPTVAYVGGPGEVAYFAQLKEVYSMFGIPMPVICVRDGATLIEPKIARIMRKLGLHDADLMRQPEELAGALVRRGDLAVFTEQLHHLREEVYLQLAQMSDLLGAIDVSLQGTVSSTNGKIEGTLKVLEKKAVSAAKRRSEQMAAQLKRMSGQCAPAGVPQERVFTIVPYLDIYGMQLIAQLYTIFKAEGAGHHVVHL